MTNQTPQERLDERLDHLVHDYKNEPSDRLGTADERDYFRALDRVARDPQTDPRTLERLGERYAAHFIVPYLKAKDTVELIAEIAALVEIHRRGTIRLHDYNELGHKVEAIVAFELIDADGRRTGPTRFDVALLKAALATRHKTVEIVPIPSRGLVSERLHIRLER